jgi:hypothetical protein
MMDSLRTVHGSSRRLSLVILVILFLVGFFVFSGLRRAAERSKNEKCLANLKQMSLALHQYALDYDGVFPWDASGISPQCRFLGKLHAAYAASLRLFWCPLSNDEVIETWKTSALYTAEPFNETGVGDLSYAYGHNQGKPWTEKDPGTVRLVADKYTTHDYVKEPFPEGRPLNHSMGISFFGVRQCDVSRYGGRNYLQLDGVAPSRITGKFEPPRWDNDIGPLEADPRTEFNNSGDPKHDQTGPDWWSDPPDK